MPILDLARATTIVGKAEAAFAGGTVRNPYQPFADAGATSRLEAIQSIQLTLAEYYMHAKRDAGELADFNHYSRLSSGIVMRIILDSDAPPEEAQVLGDTESVDSFVEYLRSLDGLGQDYWQSVYERLDLQFPSCPPAPTTKAPWWRFW